mmetsp:Transcript_9772/g.17749  ORF Transcript_9772/g.17749 Transcript_9772/m.17749 type:complete len:221 (-) Transcript_9772:559-1221(-)
MEGQLLHLRLLVAEAEHLLRRLLAEVVATGELDDGPAALGEVVGLGVQGGLEGALGVCVVLGLELDLLVVLPHLVLLEALQKVLLLAVLRKVDCGGAEDGLVCLLRLAAQVVDLLLLLEFRLVLTGQEGVELGAVNLRRVSAYASACAGPAPTGGGRSRRSRLGRRLGPAPPRRGRPHDLLLLDVVHEGRHVHHRARLFLVNVRGVEDGVLVLLRLSLVV